MESWTPHDTRSRPSRVLLWTATAVVSILALLLVRDLADPCRGQFTDLLGCVAAGYEADQADLWAEWCAEVETRFVSHDGRFIHPAYEADYERGCAPGVNMLTLDAEGLP